MAITTTVVNSAKVIYPNGVNLTSDTVKVALFTSSATITASSTLYSGLTNEVGNGSGYTTGGNTITSPVWSGTTTAKFTGTIPNWTSASFTFRYAVIYGSATSKIVETIDFGTDQTISNGTLTLTFDTLGMLSVTSS